MDQVPGNADGDRRYGPRKSKYGSEVHVEVSILDHRLRTLIEARTCHRRSTDRDSPRSQAGSRGSAEPLLRLQPHGRSARAKRSSPPARAQVLFRVGCQAEGPVAGLRDPCYAGRTANRAGQASSSYRSPDQGGLRCGAHRRKENCLTTVVSHLIFNLSVI
jgi:hypothetical protein